MLIFLPMQNGAYNINLKLVIGQNFKVSHSVITVCHHHCLLFVVMIQVGRISWPSELWSGVVSQPSVSWHHPLKNTLLLNFTSNNMSVQTPPTFNSVHAGTAVHSLPRSLTAHLQLADWQVWIAEIISHHFGSVHRHLNDVTWGLCKCRRLGVGLSVAKSVLLHSVHWIL